MSVSRTAARPKAPRSKHDILVSWQSGGLPYRRALTLTGMKTVTELYEAARNSGVDMRITMLPAEARAAKRATKAIRAALALADA